MTHQNFAVEQLLAETVGVSWFVDRDKDGRPAVSVEFADGHREIMRVTREDEPADEADVRFIASSRRDAATLVKAVRGDQGVSESDLDEIDARCGRAAPRPWIAFIESDGGLAGCDVIRVTEGDDQPDLYLWLGSALAPSGTFRFVAAARNEIPELLDRVRTDAG